jgi:hypothetical protein
MLAVVALMFFRVKPERTRELCEPAVVQSLGSWMVRFGPFFGGRPDDMPRALQGQHRLLLIYLTRRCSPHIMRVFNRPRGRICKGAVP